MDLSVIIVNYNVKALLEQTLQSVYKAIGNLSVEIIVVDNHSADDSCELVREKFKEVVLIENKENLGFSKANNQGVAIAKGEYILFVNPDTVMPEDFLQKQTARILGMDAARLDLSQPLDTMGLDSLMAMEVQKHVLARLGVAVPVAEFLQGASIRQLARTIAAGLNGKAATEGRAGATAEVVEGEL